MYGLRHGQSEQAFRHTHQGVHAKRLDQVVDAFCRLFVIGVVVRFCGVVVVVGVVRLNCGRCLFVIGDGGLIGAILFGGALSPSAKLVVSFKVARALEKLKRTEEAMDQYYTQVVLAYRRERVGGARLDDEARAVFSKAAFRLADEFEGRGKDRQAVAVLDLVATSDSPAAEEARKRIRRLTEKGGIL